MPITAKAAVKEVQDLTILAARAFSPFLQKAFLLSGHPGANG
jgi:hypothetical protein